MLVSNKTYIQHKSRSQRYIAMCLIVLTMIVSVLSGCSHSGEVAAPTGTSVQESTEITVHETSSAEENTSPYSPEEIAAAREAFDELCGQFLHDQLSSSFINLHYSLTSPENYGITDYEVSFGDFSLEAMGEDRQAIKEIQGALQKIDCSLLDEEQQLTYRILQETFRLEEAGEGFDLYYQPLSPGIGVQAQLPILLAEFVFREKQDIDDYLTLLSTIDDYYQQILDFEKEKSTAGLFLTDACIDQIVTECEGYLLPAENNFMTTMFDNRINALEWLTEEDRDGYRAENLRIISNDFIPAYELLLDGLRSLKGTCTNTQGLCYYPDGTAYYEYLLFAGTGTSYDTVEALRDAISTQIDNDLLAMSSVIQEHPEVVDEIDGYAFSYTEPTQILEHLNTEIAGDFPQISLGQYEMKTVPDELSSTLAPAFFLVPPIDDYQDCTIYINPGSTSDFQSLYPTLAHEGIPGHMYQNTYFQSNCRSPLRKIMSFTCYSEGWASYVENYSYTTDNGLSPALGQLLAHNAAATLGLHAILDININYFGWSRDQVNRFLAPYFDVSDSDLVDSIYNAMLNAPVNYLEYYVGYLEIINLRDQAQEALGDDFVLKDFNQFLLDIGPAPFTIIQEKFREWLD